MVSGLAGIAIFLGVAASTGAFVRSAFKKNKRPTIRSILVALFVVPFAAASVSGLITGPLELLGRVPGLSIVAWLVATAVLVVMCAIGGHFLASVMGEPKGAQAGDVMRGAQLSTADRWQTRTQRMQARDVGVVSLAGLAIDRADEPKHFLFMGTTGTGKSLAIREMLRGAEARAELRTMLAGTAAEPFLAEGGAKLFDSVRSSSGDAMSALEYASSAVGGAPFSLTRWATDPDDRRWVFMPYRADQIAAMKSLIGPWMRLAIFATMSRPEGDGLPTWFVADELDAIGKIEGLDDALQRIRKFGGRCVLGFQTIGKVRALYGDGAAAALVENCSSRLILRCAGGDNASTARFASSLIGQQSFMKQSSNEGAGPGGKSWSNSLSAHTEDAVMPSEIERLPDLSGYLKVPSRPEWFMAKIAYQEMPQRTATFVGV